jgi:hypothetical protein
MQLGIRKMKIKKFNKKAQESGAPMLLPSQAVKLVIAIACFILLVIVAVAITNFFIRDDPVRIAKGNLRELIIQINSATEGVVREHMVLGPRGWYIMFFNKEEDFLSVCNGKDCICICPDDNFEGCIKYKDLCAPLDYNLKLGLAGINYGGYLKDRDNILLIDGVTMFKILKIRENLTIFTGNQEDFLNLLNQEVNDSVNLDLLTQEISYSGKKIKVTALILSSLDIYTQTKSSFESQGSLMDSYKLNGLSTISIGDADQRGFNSEEVLKIIQRNQEIGKIISTEFNKVCLRYYLLTPIGVITEKGLIYLDSSMISNVFNVPYGEDSLFTPTIVYTANYEGQLVEIKYKRLNECKT